MEDDIHVNTGLVDDILNYVNGMFYKCEYHNGRWMTVYISDGCTQLTGHSKEELLYNLSFPLGDILHTDDKKWSLANCFNTFKHNVACNSEYRIITRDGQVKYVRNVATAGYDGNGELQYIEGFMQESLLNIRERKFLKELNAYKYAINENIMVVEVDVAGKLVYANKRFCTMMHYRVGEIAGKSIEALQPGICKLLSSYYAAERPIQSKTHRSVTEMRDNDGSVHWLDQVIVPIFEGQQIEKYLFLCIEITEAVSTDRLKNEYIKMLEDMLFMVSHKVRQPVSHILGIAQLVDEQLISADELMKVSGYIKDAAGMLDTVTREMTQFLSEHRQKHS